MLFIDSSREEEARKALHDLSASECKIIGRLLTQLGLRVELSEDSYQQLHQNRPDWLHDITTDEVQPMVADPERELAIIQHDGRILPVTFVLKPEFMNSFVKEGILPDKMCHPLLVSIQHKGIPIKQSATVQVVFPIHGHDRVAIVTILLFIYPSEHWLHPTPLLIGKQFLDTYGITFNEETNEFASTKDYLFNSNVIPVSQLNECLEKLKS